MARSAAVADDARVAALELDRAVRARRRHDCDAVRSDVVEQRAGAAGLDEDGDAAAVARHAAAQPRTTSGTQSASRVATTTDTPPWMNAAWSASSGGSCRWSPVIPRMITARRLAGPSQAPRSRTARQDPGLGACVLGGGQCTSADSASAACQPQRGSSRIARASATWSAWPSAMIELACSAEVIRPTARVTTPVAARMRAAAGHLVARADRHARLCGQAGGRYADVIDADGLGRADVFDSVVDGPSRPRPSRSPRCACRAVTFDGTTARTASSTCSGKRRRSVSGPPKASSRW